MDTQIESRNTLPSGMRMMSGNYIIFLTQLSTPGLALCGNKQPKLHCFLPWGIMFGTEQVCLATY